MSSGDSTNTCSRCRRTERTFGAIAAQFVRSRGVTSVTESRLLATVEVMSDQTTPLGAPLTTPEGFVALYRRESKLVLRFCARRVLDAETAVDLCAETFAEAFRSRRGFRGATEPEARAWLFTIARRQVARYLKKGALDRRARDAIGLQTPQLHDGEAEEIEREAGLAALKAALA